jgi:pimeloyl-ACP methyl ester carboxylesterase
MENNLSDSDFPDYWVKVAELNIHYKCLGKGPPVVLIHGGGNDWHEWKDNLAFIAQKFQVYAPDLPGFGLSPYPETPVSPSWSTAFLKNLMDSLGIKNTCLVGHSMGAMISIAFAASYPETVKKLVLIDSSGIGKLSRMGRFLLSIFRTVDSWQGKKRGPQYSFSPIEKWQVRDDLPRIQTPTLIIWGQNDIYFPVSHSRLAHNLIPGSQLYIFPCCGHAPQRRYAAKLNSLVTEFLESD